MICTVYLKENKKSFNDRTNFSDVVKINFKSMYSAFLYMGDRIK